MKRHLTSLLVLVAITAPAFGQESSWWDRTRIGVLAFGDAYYLAESHDEELEGANGFWFRRIYLTIDHKIDDRLSARLRLEGSHPGDFETAESMDAFIKDAYVRYTFSDRHQLIAGLQSPPSFAVIEDVWGYRSIEKTPNDLFRIHSSRDIGLAARGNLSTGDTLAYHVMLGNGNSVRNENNEGKYVGGSLAFSPSDRFLVQIYADQDARPGETDRSSLQAFAAWQDERMRLGVQYLQQERDHPSGGSDLGVASIFGIFELNERASLITRWDRTFDPVPDASRIEYVPVAANAEVDLLIVGVDWRLHPRAGLIPNVEYLSYNAASGPDPDDDLLSRLTFYISF